MKCFLKFMLVSAPFLCVPLTLCACDSQIQLQKSTVTLALPTWPPQDAFQNQYPPLEKWHITINYGDHLLDYAAHPSSASFAVELNGTQPISVQAVPVTYGTEFFFPCGTILPFSAELSWQGGFCASIQDRFYKANQLSKNPQLYAQLFNWPKFMEQLSIKSAASKIFYNPWLLNQEQILKNLSNGEFSALLLTQRQCYEISREILEQKAEGLFLSSYIPQNQSAAKNGSFTVPSKTQTTFMCISREKTFLAGVSVDRQEILSVTSTEIPIK